MSDFGRIGHLAWGAVGKTNEVTFMVIGPTTSVWSGKTLAANECLVLRGHGTYYDGLIEPGVIGRVRLDQSDIEWLDDD